MLSTTEINIATRICYAYQNKSQKFRTSEFYATPFQFSAKVTDCQNVVNQYDIPTIMRYDNNNNLAYIPANGFDPSLRFNRKVQTDTSGYLAQLCPKILSNQPVSNTTTQQNVKVQITFIKEETNGFLLDGYFLQYFNKQTDGTYLIDSAEKFKVPTDGSSGPGIRGMDRFYSTQKVCASKFDKNKFLNFEQTTSR